MSKCACALVLCSVGLQESANNNLCDVQIAVQHKKVGTIRLVSPPLALAKIKCDCFHVSLQIPNAIVDTFSYTSDN